MLATRRSILGKGLLRTFTAAPRLPYDRARAVKTRMRAEERASDGRDQARGVTKEYAGRRPRGRRRQPDDRERRVHGARRPVRLRQVDAAADDRRARGDHRRPRSRSATATSRTSRRATATSRWSSRTTRSTRTCRVAQEPRLRAARAQDAEGGDRAARRRGRRRCSGSRSCSSGARARSRAASASASRWAARSCASRQAFLMDEPLSNLDAKLRVDMRGELARLHERLGVTTVYVTHDQVEAMTLGQRVAVMRDGKIQQVDTPQTLYRQPANLFVAAFIGSPVDEPRRGRARRTAHVEFAGYRIPLAATGAPGSVGGGTRHPRHPPAGLRGRRARRPGAADDRRSTPAVVEELGSATHVIFPIDAPPVDVGLGARGERRQRARSAARDRPPGALHRRGRRDEHGAQVGREPDGSRSTRRGFHFFDRETGEALAAAKA